MKQVTQSNKTGEIRVERVPRPRLKLGHALVRTRYSVISAGTERSSISARQSTLFGKAKRNPELIQKVLEQVRQYGLLPTYKRVRARLDASSSIGYSASGIVLAVGAEITDFKPGDKVACGGGGYANHAEYILVPKNLCAKVPSGVELSDAAYTTLGAIALQSIRLARPTMGETVVVIGLGLVGQLTVQLLKANGCAVVGIDLDADAVKLARLSGADIALGRSEDVKKVVHSFTGGLGADAVIITAATRSNDPVQLAGEVCREKGQVVLVGDVGIQLPRAPYYMKELEFKISRSYGPGRYDVNYEERGQDYPVGYVRWTEKRNMQEFLRLVEQKKVDVKKLTTHRFSVDQARAAYAMITNGRRGHTKYVGVVLEYDSSEQKGRGAETKIELEPSDVSSGPLNIGFVGAGNFAQGFLLPPVQSFGGTKLIGVCTGSGLSAANVGKNFGFRFATTAAEEVIESKDIGTVFIATRHNSHAAYTLMALRKAKNVFVEKPLALNADELQSIVKLYRALTKRALNTTRVPLLMVGFNRRFAPHVQRAKKFFENAVGPFGIQYRIHAGFVPLDHWTQDPVEGGGRIVGEVCHFIDLIHYFANSRPVRVYAESLVGDPHARSDDSLVVTLKFENGSVGVVTYLSNGDTSVPKEYLEIFSTGRTAIIENFQTLRLYQHGKSEEQKLSYVDKGHREEVRKFLEAAKNGTTSPIDFESVATTTAVTFKILDSLKLGAPVSIEH